MMKIQTKQNKTDGLRSSPGRLANKILREKKGKKRKINAL